MKKGLKVSFWGALTLGVVSLVLFSPTIDAKMKYKTQAYDKKISERQEFSKGTLKNVRLTEADGGVEIESLDESGGEYMTEIIKAPFHATHLGLHWKEKHVDNDALSVYLRTSMNGSDFGPWMEVEANLEESRNDDDKQERFAYLVGISGAQYAQAKVGFVGSSDAPQKLKQFTFTFIDSLHAPEYSDKKISLASYAIAQTIGMVKTSPHGQSVAVITREDWGADDESYRENASGGEDWPRSYHGTRKIVVHHTADGASNGELNIENNMATVRAVYYYHAVTRAWGDIGYNALVDAAGNIYEGRYGTPGSDFNRTNPSADEIMVLDVEAAHASGYNSGSFGVAALGDFTDFSVPSDQRNSLRDVLAYVADSRGIDVQASSDFMQYNGSWHNDLDNTVGHRDVVATVCPGESLYGEITSLRSDVDNLPGMPSNLHGFIAVKDGNDISAQSIGSGTIAIDWDDFDNAQGYKYALEKVYGTIAAPQTWESAWMNELNTFETSVSQIDLSTDAMDPNSQYVLYVAAVDASGVVLSTISHVNFATNDLDQIDENAPTVEIITPADGTEVTKKDRVNVTVNANDDVGVSEIQIVFDGNTRVTCDNTTSCSTTIQMRKVSLGEHAIETSAYDLAGNVGSANILIHVVDSNGGGDPDGEEPGGGKCSPWPACKKK